MYGVSYDTRGVIVDASQPSLRFALHVIFLAYVARPSSIAPPTSQLLARQAYLFMYDSQMEAVS